MKEQLGEEPDPNEMPYDGSDLCYEAQLAMAIFSKLPDKVDSMGGVWLGKDYAGIGDIFDMYEVSNTERKDIFEYIHTAVVESSKLYEEKRKLSNRILETKGRVK